MKTFITETIKENEKFAGPKINAHSWADAENLAQEWGVTLVGELELTIPTISPCVIFTV